MSKPVSLIGAPTDVGASVRGAGMGPDALRVAGLAEALRRHRFDVIDRGNLAGPPNPWLPPQGGIRHLDEVVDVEPGRRSSGRRRRWPKAMCRC